MLMFKRIRVCLLTGLWLVSLGGVPTGFCFAQDIADAASNAAVVQTQTPTDRVKAAINDILVVLRNENLSREQKWSEIGRVIDAGFDFRSMSQSVLATNWQKASKEEKRQFVEYFSQYLEDTYRNKIESYSNQKVNYLNETIKRNRAIVDTVIVTDQNQIPVTYKLKNNDGEWFAYDVVIEGVSLVNNYRSTFTAIIRSEGMDGLLTDLEGRIESYKQKHGGLPEAQ